MELLQLSLLCICGVFLLLLVGRNNAAFSLLLCVILGVFFLEKSCTYLESLLQGMTELKQKLTALGKYPELLLKAIGCTFVTSFASNLCRDAGYGGLAVQMETVGKIYLLFLSLPVVLALVRLLEGLCP